MSYLVHHGIKGQKWGIRRYQNEDGSYTDEGKKRRISTTKKVLIGVAATTAVAAGSVLVYKLLRNRKIDDVYDAAKKDVQAMSDARNEAENLVNYLDSQMDYFKMYKDPAGQRAKKLYAETKSNYEKFSGRVTDAAKNIPYEKWNAANAAEKSLSSFKFEKVWRRDAKGNVSSIDLPVDREGYAKAFAKKMTKNSSNPKKDYDYWFKYMMSKYKFQ